MNDITVILRKHFGEDSIIEHLWSGDLRIINEHGEIEFNYHAFGRPIGDAELYKAYINCSHELFGFAIADGTSQDVTAAQAWGEHLNIPVDPQIWDNSHNSQTFGWSIPIFAVSCYLLHFIFSGWIIPAVSLIVAVFIGCGVLRPIFVKSSWREARHRGQPFRKIHPPIRGRDIED